MLSLRIAVGADHLNVRLVRSKLGRLRARKAGTAAARLCRRCIKLFLQFSQRSGLVDFALDDLHHGFVVLSHRLLRLFLGAWLRSVRNCVRLVFHF